MKILLTGFDPFGGEALNPSWEAVRHAACSGAELIRAQIPTSYRRAPECLRLLGFRRSAEPLLREIRRKASLPLISKPARGKAYLADDARAELLWSLGAGQPASLFEQSPAVVPFSESVNSEDIQP